MKPSVLITGAGGGMGRASAIALRDRGYTVFALDKQAIEPQEGIIPLVADVTDEQSLRAAMEQVAALCPSLTAIVHFAGIYLLHSLVEMDRQDFERIVKVNLGGAFLVNKTFLPLLGEGSRILIITSELAVTDPLPFTGIYAVTKGALDRYAYSLRMELQLKGISVSVLRAGAVATDMLDVSTAALDRFCRETTLYSCNAARFKRIVEGVEARQIPPERLAHKVCAILGKKRPAFAYAVNRNPLLLLLDALPKRWQLAIIARILR